MEMESNIEDVATESCESAGSGEKEVVRKDYKDAMTSTEKSILHPHPAADQGPDTPATIIQNCLFYTRSTLHSLLHLHRPSILHPQL